MTKEKTRMRKPPTQIEALEAALAASERRCAHLRTVNGELEVALNNQRTHLRALTDIRQRLHALDEVLVRIGVPLI